MSDEAPGKVPIAIASILLAATACMAFGCKSENDSAVAPTGIAAAFSASGTVPAPDEVRLAGGAASGDLVSVDVAVGGPTTSTRLYSFAFDIVIGAPDVLTLVASSAVAGPALSPSGCSGIRALATLQSNRVVVGVTKLGACGGNGTTAAEETVVRLTFRVLRVGITTLTLAGSSGNGGQPGNPPSALDPNGVVIRTIVFDGAPAAITGG